jgi:hypothetical protein
VQAEFNVVFWYVRTVSVGILKSCGDHRLQTPLRDLRYSDTGYQHCVSEKATPTMFRADLNKPGLRDLDTPPFQLST